MVGELASNRDARAGEDGAPVHVFDSMGRWVAVLACLVAAISALAGMPPAATAATSILGALAVVVTRVRARSVGPRRSATAVADDILAARSVPAIEARVRAELESWSEFSLSWCALVPVVPAHDPVGLSGSALTDLHRILAAVDLSDLRPRSLELARGEAVALTCGVDSGLVLVVASPQWISEDAVAAIGELAAISGAAARQVALDAEITERRESARFETLVQFSSDAIFIVDAAGTIRYAAPSVTSVLGRWSVDVVGVALRDLVVPEQADDVSTFLANVQSLDARNAASAALRFVRGDGTEIDGEMTGANLLDSSDVRGIVVTVRDISSRVELEQQLRHQAFHDGLTGLANRALFRDRLDRAMRVRRDPTDNAPAVVYLDLDGFKALNDNFGHAAGDQALRSVAERITGCLRGGDTAARLGGDEFAVLLEDIPDDRALVELVQRVVDAVAAPMTIGTDTVVRIAASAGIATCAGEVASSDDLLRRADMAMYRAKAGVQQVVQYESAMHDVVHDRLRLSADLDTAIRERELEVHYQPIIDLVTERIVAVEAFVRWSHPTRGPLGPGDFLDIAEETGLIVPLGAQVLDVALRDLASWHDLGVGGFGLSVNVSARQFLHDDFEDVVRDALARHSAEPTLLHLEITEDVLTVGEQMAQDRLRSLAALGIGVALDDFGTGQSSLRTLQTLPVDQLKIDRSFVSLLREHESVVARSIVDLAATLGASAVAEGIEHPDELAALRRLGCRLGQGNLFGSPVPATEVLPMLLAERLMGEPHAT
ncbi:putative bifunctional diguanylate cyclase/phosphodiesterase [Actinospongicola halichondriae]|uniref:putative bifunctional diguanylate cyclase/phosphodiesterase n=1 Tax=Actinospongicola halichondriae TaxID=3236844 RepID=UPI003D4F25A5